MEFFRFDLSENCCGRKSSLFLVCLTNFCKNRLVHLGSNNIKFANTEIFFFNLHKILRNLSSHSYIMTCSCWIKFSQKKKRFYQEIFWTLNDSRASLNFSGEEKKFQSWKYYFCKILSDRYVRPWTNIRIIIIAIIVDRRRNNSKTYQQQSAEAWMLQQFNFVANIREKDSQPETQNLLLSIGNFWKIFSVKFFMLFL